MTQRFDATSTTDDVLAGIDLSGKRVLVTGVSAGLGVETARALAAHGAHVVGAARDLAKAEAATAVVRADAANGGSLELIELDLASLASVRACADALVARAAEPFDLVIANAGVMATPLGHTADGFETQFGTNHLGHFVLVNRIALADEAGARLVILSSAGHRYADVDLDDPNFERTPYDPLVAYGRSKTAKILFAVEFDRRHRDRGVRATAVHPGGIQTELGRHMGQGVLEALVNAINADLAAEGKTFSWKTIPAGRRDLGLGGRRRLGRRGRWPLLRELPRRAGGAPRARSTRSARACAPMRSIPSAHGRCGRRARNWSANASDRRSYRQCAGWGVPGALPALVLPVGIPAVGRGDRFDRPDPRGLAQRRQDAGPDAGAAPAPPSRVDGGRGAIVAGAVLPAAAAPQHIHDPRNHAPIINSPRTALLRGKLGLDG